jgi:hypothetical protein
MARSRFNSPLVRISWTDAVSGNHRSSFDPELPLELRFGVDFEPSFWTSFDHATCFAAYTVYRFGVFTHRFDQLIDARSLPGAPGSQLWIGLRLGRAAQATMFYGDLMTWQPHVWFARLGGSGDGVTQWAVTPDHSAFLVEQFSQEQGFDSQQQTGGAGTPPGTPSSSLITTT